MLKIRSGIGYDLHKVEKGTALYLGGIKISDTLRFIAHSDGDVLIHALIDSLLGAVGEPDIGELFPDTEPEFKDISSTVLLQKTLEIFNNKNYEIINIDCVIIAENPKISPHKEKIRKNITSILSIPLADFNLKAKTKEKIISDLVGRGEAIECYCISLVRYKS